MLLKSDAAPSSAAVQEGPDPLPSVAPAPSLRQRLTGRLSPARWQGLVSILDQSGVSGTRFLSSVIVARACGVAGMGQYAIALALVMFAQVFQQSLLLSPLTNFVHQRGAEAQRRLAGSVFLLSLGLSAVGSLVILLIGAGVFWAGQQDTAVVIMLGLSAVLPMAITEFIRRYAYALHLPWTALWLDGVTCCLTLAGLLGLAWNGELTPGLALLVLGASHALGGVAWLLGWAWHRMRWAIGGEDVGEVFRFGRWVCASEITLGLKSSANLWLLSLLEGLTAAGYYSACQSLMKAANPIVLGIGNIAEPKLASTFAQRGKADVRRVALRYAAWLGLAVLPIVALLMIGSEFLLGRVFGEEYRAFWLALVLLSGGTWLAAVSYPFGNSLQAIHRPELTFRLRLLSLAFSLMLAVILVPLGGVHGAAWTALLAAAFSLGIRWWAFQRVFGDPGTERPDRPEKGAP